MIKAIVLAATLMAWPTFRLGPTFAKTAQAKDKTETVRWHVNNYFAAMRKGDLIVIGSSLAEDYTVIGRDGKLETKPQRMEWLKGNVKYLATVKASEIKVRVYGNAAVVTGLVSIEGEGGEPASAERFTQMWVQRQANWRMVSGQITTVTHTNSASSTLEAVFPSCALVGSSVNWGQHNKSLDASGGSVFRNLIRPAMLD